MRLAAIDLGTVTSRLLIADVDEAGIHELERHRQITHLGEGLVETGRISSAAIEREVAACKEFLAAIASRNACDERPVKRLIAVATSAMRDASNSEGVRAALREIGLDVTVISGEREAQLSFLGTLSGFVGEGRVPVAQEPVLCYRSVMTVDVGGGSTEVILGSLGGNPPIPSIRREHSFNIGSRRVTDRFLPSDPPSPTELRRAQAWIRNETQDYFAGIEVQPESMIAVAGTATTVVSVRDSLVEYDHRKIHGSVVTAVELDKIVNKLAKLNLEQRKQCKGLEPGRAPVIIGGLLTLQTSLELSGLNEFTVSETDILQGILLDAHRATATRSGTL